MSERKRTKKFQGSGSKDQRSGDLAGITIETVSERQWREDAERRKVELKLVDFDEIDTLKFPGYAIAFLDYLATGEGCTRGVLIASATSADDFRKRLIAAWGSYFARGCEIRQGTEPIPGYETLIPKHAESILRDIQSNQESGPGNFQFAATLHANYS